MQQSSSILALAAELLAGPEGGATVILGAGASVSSGIPTWQTLAEEVCERFRIPLDGRDAGEALLAHFARPDIPYANRYSMLRPYLDRGVPSKGYAHLSRLVRDGFVSTILTTNWDPLLETALYRTVGPKQVRILVRGEMTDEAIADTLAWRRGIPTVVKLHGDLQARRILIGTDETRAFGDRLASELKARVSRLTYLIGHSAQDIDVLSTLLSSPRHEGSLYWARLESDLDSPITNLFRNAHAQVISGVQKKVLAEHGEFNVADFDDFFTQLNLAVQRDISLTAARRKQLVRAERSILDKERIGVGYINFAGVAELVELFSLQVKKQDPGLILFINDPSAPGGMELKRHLMPHIRAIPGLADVPVRDIQIEGDSGSRTHNRRVRTDLQDLDAADPASVLILDAISFSGNTLDLARAAVRDALPHASVVVGVLVASQQLVEGGAMPDLLRQLVTDRHEIFFPWGVTQTTSTFSRHFEGAEPNEGREVGIVKRPWGTIEVLADDEVTSVRLLTIEGQRRLSFQRHFCRDELLVALDDNIGLDICAADLDRDADSYDERVKSLILEKGDYVLVPRGVWHREKASMDRVRLLEVAFGLYDQEDDIERRWDDYARSRQDGST